jgi:DnaJ-class molecular chaperone
MGKPIKKKRTKVVCRNCNGSGSIPDTRVGKKVTDIIPCGSCNGNKKKFKRNRNKPPEL